MNAARTNSAAILVVIAVLLTAVQSFGEKHGGVKHRGLCVLSESAVDKLYDKGTIVTVEGKLELIRETPVEGSARDTEQTSLVHVMVSTEGITRSIRIGPLSFLKAHNFSLRIGDFLTIQASAFQNCGDEILVAGSIRKGSTTLRLRDDSGKAEWLAQK